MHLGTKLVEEKIMSRTYSISHTAKNQDNLWTVNIKRFKYVLSQHGTFSVTGHPTGAET